MALGENLTISIKTPENLTGNVNYVQVIPKQLFEDDAPIICECGNNLFYNMIVSVKRLVINDNQIYTPIYGFICSECHKKITDNEN